MQYNVLKEFYHQAGRDQSGTMQYTISWKKIGEAYSLEGAKLLYGGYPVLEEAK